jgi:hypothetical protein
VFFVQGKGRRKKGDRADILSFSPASENTGGDSFGNCRPTNISLGWYLEINLLLLLTFISIHYICNHHLPIKLLSRQQRRFRRCCLDSNFSNASSILELNFFMNITKRPEDFVTDFMKGH